MHGWTSAALWIGALTQGLAYAFLAWGVFLTFRVLRFADITVDGSFTLGAAVTATLLVKEVHPVAAMLAGMGAGAAAGVITALIHTRLGVNDLLAGILTMTALYSVNLHVMGRANISLLNAKTVLSLFQQPGQTEDMLWLLLLGVLVIGCALFMDGFLRTDYGMTMRATGDNPEMIAAQGVDTRRMIVVGLALSNALVGLAGSLIAQNQTFADAGMGIGSLVAGIAALIIGEVFFGRRGIHWLVAGVAVGAVLYRLLIALALKLPFVNPFDLKIITAVLVLLLLATTRLGERMRKRKPLPAATPVTGTGR